MELKFGQFRQLLFLNSLFGMNVASLITLERHKLKVFINIVIGVLFVCEYFMYLKNSLSNNGETILILNETLTFVFSFYIVYTMVFEILKYKTKISSALEIEAIKKELESLKTHPIVGKHNLNLFYRGLYLVAVIPPFFGLYQTVLHFPQNKPITAYITSYVAMALFTVQGLTIVIYLNEVRSVQQSVVRELNAMLSSSPSTQPQRCPQRSRAPTKDKLNIQLLRLGQLKLINILQGSLNHTEMKLRAHFALPIILRFLLISLVFPTYYTQTELTFDLILFVALSHLANAIFLIIVVNQQRRSKELTGLQLINCLYDLPSESWSRNIKHQVLANIHRSSPFSCRLFEVDFGLAALMVENSVMVLTAILADS